MDIMDNLMWDEMHRRPSEHTELIKISGSTRLPDKEAEAELQRWQAAANSHAPVARNGEHVIVKSIKTSVGFDRWNAEIEVLYVVPTDGSPTFTLIQKENAEA